MCPRAGSPATNFGTGLDEHIGPHKVTRLSLRLEDTVSDSLSEGNLMSYNSLRLCLTKTKYLFNPFDFKPSQPPVLPVRPYAIYRSPMWRRTLTKANLNWWRNWDSKQKQPTQNFATVFTPTTALSRPAFSFPEGEGRTTYRIHSHLSQPYALSCLILSQGTSFTALKGLSINATASTNFR